MYRLGEEIRPMVQYFLLVQTVFNLIIQSGVVCRHCGLRCLVSDMVVKSHCTAISVNLFDSVCRPGEEIHHMLQFVRSIE